MNTFTITIDEAGQIEMIDRQELAGLKAEGRATKTRASHIMPVNFLLRQVFWFLRWATGEQVAISDWTRRWSCEWQAQIVGGPHLGTSRDRSELIAREVAWIEANQFGG